MRMMRLPLLIAILLIFLGLACSTSDFLKDIGNFNGEPSISPTATIILESPVIAGEANPDEPVLVTGTIPFTSPFFLAGNAEPFVLLEDQAGFYKRDLEFEFPLAGQAIGPVDVLDENTLSFTLPLPSVPQGTLFDLDNNGEEDKGVMVFQVAYWSNTWGGPFLEERDGTGWSTAYTSATTDPFRDHEINGGYLIIWAPDNEQSFPYGYGEDEKLFTEDDPVQSIPAGYSIVDLNSTPFRVYKEPNPIFELIEGAGAVHDYSEMSYEEAFDTMFEKVRVEYPFTEEKGINWDALYNQFAPRIASARNGEQFYRALKDFTYAIPDGHVGVSPNSDTLGRVFFEEAGGSFGLILAELSNGEVIVTDVLADTPGSRAGILPGAEIIEWEGKPVGQAISQVVPFFGPYSTEHAKREDQLIFLTRMPVGTEISVIYRNVGEQAVEATFRAEIEYESFFRAIPDLDELVLPIDAEVLDESGLGYISITTFLDDYNLMARIWERFIEGLIENEVPGLILDLRINGGGNGALALDFAGYFFNEEMVISRRSSWNERLGEWEYSDFPTRIIPGPMYYEGEVVVIVSPTCISACEGFVYAMSQNDRARIIGHAPTAGAFGSVGTGQYELPDEISMQFPTTRPETMNGELLIENRGVALDITVPVTFESAMGEVDALLQAAIEALR